MLVVSRRRYEKIIVSVPGMDENIEISIVAIGDGKVRVGIEAPRSIPVHREEVYRRIKEERSSD